MCAWISKGINSKTEAVLDQQQAIRDVKAALNEDAEQYAKLFSDVEKSFDMPVSEATLKLYRKKAEALAIVTTARMLLGDDASFDIPTEVAARYREYLENPKLLASVSAAIGEN